MNLDQILATIPGAQEARRQRDELRKERLVKEVERVTTALITAVSKGEDSVIIEPPIDNRTFLVDHLKAKGYAVTHRQTGINETGTEISW